MSDINVQTFSGKVNVANNLKVGTNHFFVDTQNNNVGIGTNNPTHTLDVEGTANVGVLTATLAGIGTDNPTHTLDVEGTANVGVLTATSAGIGTTTAPTRTLEVGSNLYVEDTGSNVLVVDGNVAATSITIGDATIVASQGLDHVTNENNTTTQVVQFNNPTTGFVTASNAVIGGTLLLQNFALSQSYGLENVTDVNNTTGDTIISSNATTGFQSTSNVSVGRDALVTGNVTVGKDLTVSEEATFSSNVTINKDLEVSGNVTNLDVLSNVNLLSVSNVVSIKKDSNVVTEFTRSKKLIKYPRVAMSQDDESGTSGYVATNNSGYTDSTGRIPYKAFNNTRVDSDDCWQIVTGGATGDGYSDTDGTYTGSTRLSSNTPLGEWLKLESPVAFKLQLYKISPRNSPFYNDQAPRDAEIWGSNDDTNWTKITEYSGLEFTSQTDSRSFSINSDNGKYFKYHAIIVTKNGADQFYAISIGELEYYGVPEYDPEADGVDMKVTSYPNVPNTDWLEVYYDAKDLTSVPNTVLDLSGNGRNGTLNGGVSVSDGAFVFDGVNDKIDSGPMTFTPTSSYSVSTWVKVPEVTSTQDVMFQFGHGTTGEAFGMNYGRNGQISTYIFSGQTRFTSNNLYVANEWVHVTGIWYNDGTMQIYANGSRVDSSTSGNLVALSIPSNPYLTIGIHFGGEQTSYYTGVFFKGSIANFRLFNRALSSDEIYPLYAYQKEYFGHGNLNMTFKAGRLGIGTSEPRAALDVKGDVHISGSLRKTRARMIRKESSSISFTQDGWQTFVSYGEEWTAYSNNPLYSVSITGDFVDGTSRAINYRLAVQNQRTMEIAYFPSSSGWRKYHYTTHTRLDGHGYLGIMSDLTLGDSYKVQLEVDPNSVSNYQWESIYGTITGLVWD
jgi:hypothetical protein